MEERDENEVENNGEDLLQKEDMLMIIWMMWITLII